MLRLEVISVEQKIGKQSQKPYWRFRASDGQYYNAFQPLGVGVYDFELNEKGLIKSFVPVQGEVKKEPTREPVSAPTVSKDRAFCVSYGKDAAVSIEAKNIQEFLDNWTLATAHAVFLMEIDRDELYAKAQAIEEAVVDAPPETTEEVPF